MRAWEEVFGMFFSDRAGVYDKEDKNDDKETLEYGVIHNARGEIHRDGMTLEEAEKWVKEWVELGGKEGVFSVAVRSHSPWRKV